MAKKIVKLLQKGPAYLWILVLEATDDLAMRKG
jgi:hypothetical protein